MGRAVVKARQDWPIRTDEGRHIIGGVFYLEDLIDVNKSARGGCQAPRGYRSDVPDHDWNEHYASGFMPRDSEIIGRIRAVHGLA
jgi:hypothetical protein